MKLRRICCAAALTVAGLALAAPAASADVHVERSSSSQVVVGGIMVDHEEETSVHVG